MERMIMLGFSAVALDVGGVIYYDEPFELAWLQEHFEQVSKADSAVTLAVFLECVERFYHQDVSPDSWTAPEGWDALAAQAWAVVGKAWCELAQEIPGAVRAVRAISARVPTVVVANQPPECMAVLDRWGLTEALRGVFLDSLSGIAKPDPGLLELGRTHLGVPPGDVVMVGNRVDHDVRPALALGCGAVFVLGDHGYRTPPGVHPDLRDVYERLRAIRTAAPAPGEAVAIVSSLAELGVLAESGHPSGP